MFYAVSSSRSSLLLLLCLVCLSYCFGVLQVKLQRKPRSKAEDALFFKNLHAAHEHAMSGMHSGEEIAIGLSNIKNVGYIICAVKTINSYERHNILVQLGSVHHHSTWK